MKNTVFILLFIFGSLINIFATHNRAGEITFRHISGLTYEVTILTYTFTPSPADRPFLEIKWGDGTKDTLNRSQKINYPGDISRNIYQGTHSYLAAGTFTISLEDPNRNGGVVNIPNSINTVFYIETKLVINPFLGPNNSPVLQYPPLDYACAYKLFIHNPGAYDSDGDSLSYKLIPCKEGKGANIKGYTYPVATNVFKIDPITGDLTWDTPNQLGEFNIAILIEEWRKGIFIGSIIRDMQVLVLACNNDPPFITSITDTCVEAGTYLQFKVTATDPNNDHVTLTATGGPLVMTANPASFNQPLTGLGTISSDFKWNTKCEHIKQQPHTMLFRAVDNASPVKLVSLKTVRITVVGPAPENLTAAPVGNTIHLKWDKSNCENAIGYKIYRRDGYYGFFHGHCETGIPSYTAYKQIASIPNINDTIFVDNNNNKGLIHGIDYCYMVYAYYSDGAKSYASLEACASLIKDIPVITHVSIRNTHLLNGSVYVSWSKPTQLDTIQAKGPYKYLINRSVGLNSTNFTLIDSLSFLNDTIYIDSLLNTKENLYNYRIDLYNNTVGNRFLVGSTQIAPSIFISLIPGDNKLSINWNSNVPWKNDTFVVYRQNASMLFDSIGFSVQSPYIDTGLVNGQTYCYKVKSIGRYSAPGFINPIINYSQIACGIPIDNEAPCAPLLKINYDCIAVENHLIWTNPNSSCANDVIGYEIYYSPLKYGDFTLIQTINNPVTISYTHSGLTSIAGCYFVVAVDSFQNKSPFSNYICIDIDSCDLYRLPNVFTPNGDNKNDLFKPFPYNFVDHIDIQIYNRWGQIVFTTENPDVNWDGKHKNSGEQCLDGVYFYVCDVYEIRLEGLKKRTIQGVVHIFSQ